MLLNLSESTETLSVFYCLMHQKIYDDCRCNTKISVSQALSSDMCSIFIAIKAKSYFENVDVLIAKVKSAAVKNKTRQAKFATIG